MRSLVAKFAGGRPREKKRATSSRDMQPQATVALAKPCGPETLTHDWTQYGCIDTPPLRIPVCPVVMAVPDF